MEIVCPKCRQSSKLTNELTVCTGCGHRFLDKFGVLDFVNTSDRAAERSFYDRAYAESRKEIGDKCNVASVIPEWNQPDAPENRIVLDRVGNLDGKAVLLLGNGESVKELLFLENNPKHLIYSDLSTHALSNIRDRFDLEMYQEILTFAAIDAHEIPFDDDSFDVIYGYAMVHHLPDLDRFFKSVMRVLKPGGRAVFMDDAFAPIWHYSKQTWLKPLMKLSHKRTGISPEDYRFSMTGGFKEALLAARIEKAGGDPWFSRTSLLTYVVYRGTRKLLPAKLNSTLRSPTIARVVLSVDRLLCRLPFLKGNQIRLVWGFEKPSQNSTLCL